MKKLTAIFLALTMIFAFASCANQTQFGNALTTEDEQTQTTAKAKEQNSLKIGVFEAQSGEYEKSGKQNILAVQYARSLKSSVKINDKKYTVKLDIVDAGASDESAKEAAQKLIDDGVSVVLGCRSAGLLSSVFKMFENAGIAVIDYSSSSVNLRNNSSNVFSLCLSDYKQAKKCAEFAYNTLQAKKVFVISELGNDESQALAFYFKEAMEAYSASCKVEFFESDAVDFNEVIAKAKKGEYDAVFAPTALSFANDIISECKAAKLNIPIIASDNWDGTIFLDSKISFDVYNYSSCKLGKSSKILSSFASWISADADLKYLNGNSDVMSNASVLAYDAYNLALKVIQKAASKNSTDILKALPGVELKGESSTIKFDSNRVNSNAVSIVKKSKIVVN